MPSITETAQAFLAIGGRVWIGPDDSVGAMLDADRIFSCDLSDAETERRQMTGRAFLSAKAADPAAVATLVRERGQPQGAFIVWEA